MRKITWRFWLTSSALVVAYFIIGMSARVQAHADLWLYRVGLTGTTLVAIVFILGYTLYGLTVRGAARWWKTDLGTSLVVVTAAFLPSFGALAYVFDFKNGMLLPGFLAWVALSGPLIEALALTWRSYVWLRALEQMRQGKNSSR